MSNDSKNLENLLFQCSKHNKPAWAYCTEEVCQNRLLCVECIQNHPHHTDKFQNISSLFKFSNSNEPNHTSNDKVINEFKARTQSISKNYHQVQDEHCRFGHIIQLIEANSSNLVIKDDSLETIRTGLEKLGSKNPGTKVIASGTELNELINIFLIKQKGETVLTTKISHLQDEVMFLLSELSVKFGQLSSELVTAFNLKDTEEDFSKQICIKKSNCLEDNQNHQVMSMLQIELITVECEQEKGDSPSKMPNVICEVPETIEKLPIPDGLNFFAESRKVSNALPQTSTECASKDLSSEQSNEEVVLLISDTDDALVEIQPKKPKIKYTLTRAEKNAEKQTLDQEETKKFIEDISDFFNCPTFSKEGLQTFKIWFQKAQKIENLNPKLRLELEAQKTTIESYNKTKKLLDITTIAKDSDIFLQDLKIKTVKPTLRDFEKILYKRKTFIEEYQNWYHISNLKDLIDLMEKSRVDFTQQEKELRKRLTEFQSYWKMNSKSIGFRQQKINFGDFELMIQKLWTYRVKIPSLEESFNKYFDAKEIEVSVKYFLIQSRTHRKNLFSDKLDQTELSALIEQLQLTSLSDAQLLKKKAAELSKNIDFGSDFTDFEKLIKATEDVMSRMIEILKSTDKPAYQKYCYIQTQIQSLEHSLFFQEMIELRDVYLSGIKDQRSPLRQVSGSKKGSEMLDPNHLDEIRMCIEEEGPINRAEYLSRDIMIESPMPEKAPRMLNSSGRESSKRQNLTDSAVSNWFREVVEHFSQVLSLCNQEEQSKQMFSENNLGGLSTLVSYLCSSSNSGLLKTYQSQGKEALEVLLAKGLSLRPPHSRECKEMIDSLKILSWKCSARTLLSTPKQTFEELFACLSDHDSKNLEAHQIAEALEIKGRLIKFEALKDDVQQIETTSWRKIIEESRTEKIMLSLEKHEKIYNELLIDDAPTLSKIQENLKLHRLAEKIMKQRQTLQKFKLDELEAFSEIVEKSFGAEEASNEFVSNLRLVLSEVKKNSAECEKYKTLSLASLSELLSDFLQNKVNKSNFLRAITKIRKEPARIKNFLSNLTIELEPGYFDQLDNQLQIFAELPFQKGLKIERAELEHCAQLLKSHTTHSLKKFLYWVIFASAALNTMKFSFKFLSILAATCSDLLKTEALTESMTLSKSSLKEFSRLKSLYCELILVKAQMKTRSNTTANSELSPLNAEYLSGLRKRIENSRLKAPRILKQIVSLLEKNKRFEEEFDKLVENSKWGEKISQEKFNQFLEKIDNSTVISRGLEERIKGIAHQQAILDQKIHEMRTSDLSPQLLFEKMSNFCKMSYADFPVGSQKCESFLNEYEAFKPLFEIFQTLSDLAMNPTIIQFVDYQQKIDNFESQFGGNKHYHRALTQIKKTLWKAKAIRIKNISTGSSVEKHLTLSEIQSLISEWDELNIDEKDWNEQLETLIDIEKRIKSAISEINATTTLEQLEECYSSLSRQFQEVVGDLVLLHESKKAEIKQNFTLTQKPFLIASHSPSDCELITKTLPFGCDLSIKSLNEVRRNLFKGGDSASQIEEDKSEVNSQICDSQALWRDLRERPFNKSRMKLEEFSKRKNMIRNEDPIIIDSDSDTENKHPVTKAHSQELEPPLVKKVKSNEGSQILVELSQNSSDVRKDLETQQGTKTQSDNKNQLGKAQIMVQSTHSVPVLMARKSCF